MVLRRDDWLDLARKVDWTYTYVDERDVFPVALSGVPWLPQRAWQNWNEVYRTTYREYVANQRAKDEAVVGVRSALSKAHVLEGLDPGWLQVVKFHNGALRVGRVRAARSPSSGWPASAATACGGRWRPSAASTRSATPRSRCCSATTCSASTATSTGRTGRTTPTNG